MKRIALAAALLSALPFAALMLASGSATRTAEAHCEVPCGIFADQRRFEAMLEDTATIRKAMDEINALAGKSDAQSQNQLIRWVNTKEDHAKHTQHTIAQYFMAQRIKPSQATYVDRLKASHAVMTAAMKCKQTVDVAAADKLKAAILAFHKVYEPNAGKGHGHGHEHGDGHGHDHDGKGAGKGGGKRDGSGGRKGAGQGDGSGAGVGHRHKKDK